MSSFPCPQFLVSAEELRELTGSGDGGLLILDARDDDEFSAGHLPGAVHLSPSSLEWSFRLSPGREVHHLLAPAEQVGAILRACGVARGSRVVLCDQGGSCLAARLFWILDFLGHPRPAVLDGGVSAWQSAGGRFTAEPGVPSPGDFQPRPNLERFADFDEVARKMGRADVRLCNALPEPSFRREAIPGSVNVPYSHTFRESEPHLLCRPEELAALMHRSADPADELILYCGIGYTASPDCWVARLLGYPRVRLYDGSLADWTARRGPLARGGQVRLRQDPRPSRRGHQARQSSQAK